VKTDEKFQSTESSEKNTEISIHYTTFSKTWNRMETTIGGVFTYNITLEV
jgi:hypothetical protein